MTRNTPVSGTSRHATNPNIARSLIEERQPERNGRVGQNQRHWQWSIMPTVWSQNDE